MDNIDAKEKNLPKWPSAQFSQPYLRIMTSSGLIRRKMVSFLHSNFLRVCHTQTPLQWWLSPLANSNNKIPHCPLLQPSTDFAGSSKLFKLVNRTLWARAEGEEQQPWLMQNFFDKTKQQLSALSPSNLPGISSNAVASSYVKAGNDDSLEGYLMKKGEKGALKTWKNRWFILKGKKVFYYKTHLTEQPQGFIGKLLHHLKFSTVA